jgi:cell division protein FtsL
MTQEKLKRIVTAASVAGTVLIVCLLAVIVYQLVTMAVYDNRIKKTEQEIADLQTQIAQCEDELEKEQLEFYYQQKLYELGYYKTGDKVVVITSEEGDN